MKIFKKIFSAWLFACVSLLLFSCGFAGGSTPGSDTTHTHKVLHWEIAEEVSCEQSGRRFGTCIDCMNEVRDEQAPYGHDYRGGACVRCGKNETAAEKSPFTYSLNYEGTGYIVTAFNGEYTSHVDIPAEYCGLPVVSIGSSAFMNNEFIESVVIPDSVVSIGRGSFRGCHNLRNITVSKNLISIGTGAFRWCRSLREIKLPDSIDYIPPSCFSGCSSLESFEAGGCKKIDMSAFKDCERLYSFDFFENIEYIGRNAFDNCAVTNVTIPASATHLGGNAFRGSFVRSVRFASSAENNEGCLFVDCPMLETVFVETNGIKNEFYNCKNIKTIVFEEGVTEIGIDSVGMCESLETVYLPKSLEFMGETFYGSLSLKKIVYKGTSEEWLSLKRNLYWSFMNEECVIECADRTLTRDDLRAAESIE
ncbi:MAG: leucine-rich repeat domain-containing protein [Clostridia bacterium]|nr:leucine-rich repeat domain-containing protein [Clostridia bacterium]